MTLGVCCILGHELPNLPGFLSQIRQFADQIVLVETQPDHAQSTYLDSQKDVTRYGKQWTLLRPCASERFKWVDDYSEARNAAIDLCKCDYLLSIDPDMRLSPDSVGKMREFKKNLDPGKATVYFGRLLNHAPDGNVIIESGIRVFPNRPDIRFHYRVHEDISPSLAGKNIKFGDSPVIVNHRIPAEDKQKLLYYAELVNRDLKDGKDKARCYGYLALTALNLGKYQECIDGGYLVLDNDTNRRWLRRVMNAVAESYRRLDDVAGSISWMEDVAALYPDDGMVQYYYAVALAVGGRHKDAVDAYLKAVRLNMATDCVSIPANINESLMFNLCASLRKMNRHDLANVGYISFMASIMRQYNIENKEKAHVAAA